jgi:hypothetical protein|tara:strand:- start:898 stop:1014 length:117 start_codon:yes stop_codon:yes gene_type:complete
MLHPGRCWQARLHNARYMGELLKFGLLPPAAFFGALHP